MNKWLFIGVLFVLISYALDNFWVIKDVESEVKQKDFIFSNYSVYLPKEVLLNENIFLKCKDKNGVGICYYYMVIE